LRIANHFTDLINRGGILIHLFLALGSVVAATGVEKAQETDTFHGAQGLIEGSDAQAVESDRGFSRGGVHID